MEQGNNKTYPEKQHGPKTGSGWVQPEDRTVPITTTSRRYQDRVSWWAVFYRSVPDGIGIGGMKYVFNPVEVTFRRLFWLLLILSGVGLLTYHITIRAQYLATYPTSVTVISNYEEVLAFPTVAICNYNTYRRSAVEGTEFADFLNELFDNFFAVNTSSPHAPYVDSVTMSELFTQYGHRAEETIAFGTWRSTGALSHANFTTKVTDWGLCFIFNDASNGNPPVTVTRSGKQHGLELLLNVQQYESFLEPNGRISTGFQVHIYDYGTEPRVVDHGFGIAPGTHTHVAVEVTETSNLEQPYGVCHDKPLKYFDKYGFPECFIECQSDFFFNACGCKFFATPMASNEAECTVLGFYTCGNQYYGSFVQNHTCDCPVPCSIRSYRPTISTTAYPSAYWEQKVAAENPISEDYLKENFCMLSIYFKEMSIRQITQKIDYTFFGFLCDVGGSLGLWLGGSILTFFEFFDLFGYSLFTYFKRIPNSRK
ncbi:acid-sensing ion channel 1C-like [Lytechinus pictus]|uniref:acid-sensing ion channel 1C-like n=1 Tax=Lytechinus pictus TaxID=7653 RepID=UPI0030BA1B11